MRSRIEKPSVYKEDEHTLSLRTTFDITTRPTKLEVESLATCASPSLDMSDSRD